MIYDRRIPEGWHTLQMALILHRFEMGIFMPFRFGFYNKYSIQKVLKLPGNNMYNAMWEQSAPNEVRMKKRNKQMFCQLKLDTNILLLDRMKGIVSNYYCYYYYPFCLRTQRKITVNVQCNPFSTFIIYCMYIIHIAHTFQLVERISVFSVQCSWCELDD